MNAIQRFRTTGAALVAAAQTLLACGPTERPDGGKGLLPVGATAPDFKASDERGTLVRLSDAKGKFAVVYFYPRDETPGCTKQACAFRDTFGKFDSAGIAIFGVSRDSENSHRKFRQHHQLPFPLAADEAGLVQRAYGVPSKLPGITQRVTFLVGRDGKVARVWPEVDPVLNVSQVLAAAHELAQRS